MHPTKLLTRRVCTGMAALALSLGGALGALVVVASPASAATIPVTNTNDDGTTSSLRYVLENAHSGDVIVLTANATYTLTDCKAGDINIAASVAIDGNGATIEQTCTDRVLDTQSALTLNDVVITGGDIDGAGGGLLEESNATVVLDAATFTGNTASSSGGGIATSGDLSVTDSTFTDNHDTGGDGGAIKVFAPIGTTTINGSTFTDNTTNGWGGAFEQQGPVPGAVSAAALGYVLTVTGSTFTGNTAASDGAGALDTEDANAAVTVTDSTFTDNSGGWGGGIGTFGSSTTLDVSGSTFHGNTSVDSGGAVQMGGVSLAAAAVSGLETATFVNSTITGNTQGVDGAINVDGTVELSYVTITDNTSTGVSPVKALSRGARAAVVGVDDAANVVSNGLTSFASVVTGANGGPNCESVGLATNDEGYNFSDDSSCGFDASTSNVDTPNNPVLGALANNGGPTDTRLPLSGSPLIDAIPTTTCTSFGITVDQRGITRPQGTGCDIGAVEVGAAGTASLDVTKIVTGTAGNPVPATGYTFAVSCSDGTSGTLTVANATSGGTSGTLDGIEAGAACRVTEAALVYTNTGVTGQPTVTYAPVAAGSTDGFVVSAGANTVTVTNDFSLVDLLGIAVVKPPVVTPAVTPPVAVQPAFTG
jgi:predicted outer membrane repeat protein